MGFECFEHVCNGSQSGWNKRIYWRAFKEDWTFVELWRYRLTISIRIDVEILEGVQSAGINIRFETHTYWTGRILPLLKFSFKEKGYIRFDFSKYVFQSMGKKNRREIMFSFFFRIWWEVHARAVGGRLIQRSVYRCQTFFCDCCKISLASKLNTKS